MTIILDGTNGITTPGPSVVEANTSDAALRITQTGTGNALLVEDSANPDASPLVIDANGRVVVGYTSSQTFGGSTGIPLQINGTTQGASSQSLTNWGNTSAPTSIVFSKSRGGTVSTQAVVSSGDDIGLLQFEASDGTTFIPAARILVEVDGTPGTNDMPGRLVFSTTADGASSPTEQMRITSTGDLRFNSGYGSVATAYGCRAWVNFNGTGTPAIRASGNVSSITDNGTGNWTVNFTTAMPDANYSVSGTASTLGSTNSYTHVVTTGDSGGIYGSFSTTAVRLNVWGANYSALGDPNYVMACIFR